MYYHYASDLNHMSAWPQSFYSVNRHSWAAAYDLRVSLAGHILQEHL